MHHCNLCKLLQAFITQDSGDRDFLVQNLMPFDVVVINHVDEGPNKESFEISQEARNSDFFSSNHLGVYFNTII